MASPRETRMSSEDWKASAATPGRVQSVRVVVRFLLRMAVLGVFALAGQSGFMTTMESLLMMATLYCSLVAGLRQEEPLGSELTHFDEAAGYGLLLCVAHQLA
jgi:hypothetical protein